MNGWEVGRRRAYLSFHGFVSWVARERVERHLRVLRDPGVDLNVQQGKTDFWLGLNDFGQQILTI